MPTIRSPFVYHWDRNCPPPRVALRLSARRAIPIAPPPAGLDTGPTDRPFDFGAAMHRLVADIAVRSPAMAHVDASRILFSVTRARTGARHGLQARITPLRFPGGAVEAVRRGHAYRVQQFAVEGRDMLYIIAFVMPRFLNREFDDKLVTVFHELYHISPAFDGDMRRHGGRYSAHSASQKKYDAHMHELAQAYLKAGPDRALIDFLRLSFGQLCQRHGSVVGLQLPKPKLLPVIPPPRPGPTGTFPFGRLG